MEERRPKSSRLGKGLAIGCGVVVLTLVVAAVVFVFNWRSFLGTMIRHTVESSDLPPEEQERVSALVDRVLVEEKASQEELRQLADAFQESRLSRVFLVYAAKQSYLDPSGLTPQEKERAGRDLNRLVRGIMEGQVSDLDLDTLGQDIPRDERGMVDAGVELSDEQVRGIATRLEALLERERIPDEPYDVHVADELERIVDRVLGPDDGAAPEPSQ